MSPDDFEPTIVCREGPPGLLRSVSVETMDAKLDELRGMIHVAVARAGLELVTEKRHLGELIAQERKARKLSLQEVAERSGMTKSHIWDLERGHARNPTVQAMHGLSRALGVPFLTICAAALLAAKPVVPVQP